MRNGVLALVGAVVAMLAITATALASHARPKAATPVTFKLVPAFIACGPTATNAQHGAPLTLPSCNPPVQGSEYLTFNAPDRPAPYNTAADGAATFKMKVTCLSSIEPPVENGDAPPCNANSGDQADVEVTFALVGVRCIGQEGWEYGPCAGTAAGGSLYSGKVVTNTSIWEPTEAYWRLTDHFNAHDPNPSGADCSDTQSCPGTTRDFPFEIGAQCSAGACNYATSLDAVMTNVVREGHRAVLQLGQMQVWDGGRNGDLIAAPPPTTGVCPPACTDEDPSEGPFLVQGLYLP